MGGEAGLGDEAFRDGCEKPLRLQLSSKGHRLVIARRKRFFGCLCERLRFASFGVVKEPCELELWSWVL